MKKFIIATLLLTLIPAVIAAPIDFDNLQIASATYGTVGGDGYPRLLAAYNNDIYFIVFDDGTANPSKVYRYNPSDGLSNAVNHSIVAETTGKFVTLRQIDSLLYFSDNLGHVYSYDGTTLAEISGTPFTASDHVSSIEKFKGLIYFATSTGNIFRYDGVAFEQVCDVNVTEDRYIRDMASWQKDGYLYVSVGPRNVCCPSTAYVIRSSSGDANSWETVFQNFWAVNLFMPTADYLYSAVTDSAYCHCSTIRKSSEGTAFPVMFPSDGQYKRAWGAIYYEGIAYFFVDDTHYGFGEIIIDDNGSVSSITNQNWAVTQAVELNGEIYALAGSYDGYMPGGVYLITTRQPTLNDGLVAYWSFDDDSGNIATDSSGQNNHGTIIGATLTEDRFGNPNKAYLFDGTDDYIDVPDASSLNPTDAITITAWFKASSFNLGSYSWPNIVSKRTISNDTGGYVIEIQRVWESDPSVEGIAYIEGQGYLAAGLTPITNDTWYFIAMVYDGSTLTQGVGREGQYLILSSLACSGNIAISTNNLTIGTAPIYGHRFFNGVIDEVRIYDRALTAAEVQNLYTILVAVPNVVGMTQANAQAAITSAGLVVGTVTTACHHSVPAGNVISQEPIGGQSISAGTPVNLVISLGKHYSDGDGTAGNPYQMANVADFQQLSATPTDWSLSFILTADIDLTGLTFTQAPIAPDTDSSTVDFQGTQFTGIFDGNGHKIAHFIINGGSNEYLGLFGQIGDAGSIKNISLENYTVSGYQLVGGLVGYNSHGSISNCYATGSVSGTDYVGGLVGANSGSISNCFSTGSVSSSLFAFVGGLIGFNSGSVSNCYSGGVVSSASGSQWPVGGLVGCNSYGSISNCYATGSVSGTLYVGGLVGANNCGNISNCYSTGSVSGGSYVGGLVGSNWEGSLTACFWDIYTSGQTVGVGYGTSTGVTGKTTAEMQTLATFADENWDFVTPIWTIDEGHDYPRLWWEENILYVPGHYPTIQAAIDAAVNGDMVIVAPGTYTGNGNRDIDFFGKAITVRSQNGPETCIIDCQGTQSEPHRGFHFHSGEGMDSVLSGFLITNGYGPYEQHETIPLFSTGGGIRCEGSNPLITDCIISSNWAEIAGGLFNKSANPTLINCDFKNNAVQYLGGGIYNAYSNPTLANCGFYYNSASEGAALNNMASNPVLTNCVMYSNTSGAAITNWTPASGLICEPKIINCTFYLNAGGAVYNHTEWDNCILTNCILWNNSPTEIEGGSPVVTYSNIQGGWPGIGNMNVDPLFVNPDSNDFHLLPDSPCIDAGDPNSPWENEPWPNGARINMGNYGNTPEATTSRDGLQFAGFHIVSKTRIGRTTFRYVLSLSLNNIILTDMTDVTVKLIDADDQVINVVDDEIFFPLIGAESTVNSDSLADYFIIDVDRSAPITAGRLTWQVDYTALAGSRMQMMSLGLAAALSDGVVGDITGDGKVDIEDLTILANQWLQPPGVPSADIAPSPVDGQVNLLDFAVLAENWLEGI